MLGCSFVPWDRSCLCQLRSKKVRGSGIMPIATVMHANTLLGSGAPRDFGLYSFCSVVFVQCSIVPACGCRLGRRRPPGTKVCSGKGVFGVSPKRPHQCQGVGRANVTARGCMSPEVNPTRAPMVSLKTALKRPHNNSTGCRSGRTHRE